jgi:hypothetical protein
MSTTDPIRMDPTTTAEIVHASRDSARRCCFLFSRSSILAFRYSSPPGSAEMRNVPQAGTVKAEHWRWRPDRASVSGTIGNAAHLAGSGRGRHRQSGRTAAGAAPRRQGATGGAGTRAHTRPPKPQGR